MPLAKLKPVVTEEIPFDTGGAVAHGALSARALQQRLNQRAVATPAVDKWPLRNSAALIVTVSLALWLAILTAATQAIHAVA